MSFNVPSFSALSDAEVYSCDLVWRFLSSMVSNTSGEGIVESMKRLFDVNDKRDYYDVLKTVKNCSTTPKEQVRILTCSSCQRTMITCRVFCPYCLLFNHRPTYLVKGCNNASCLANTRVNGVIQSLDGNVAKCATAFCNHVRRSATYGEVYYNHPISIIGDLISSGLFFALTNTKRSEIMNTIQQCQEGGIISTITCANTISVLAHMGEKQLADAAMKCYDSVQVPGMTVDSLKSGLLKASSSSAVEKKLFKTSLSPMNEGDKKRYRTVTDPLPPRVNSLEVQPAADETTPIHHHGT